MLNNNKEELNSFDNIEMANEAIRKGERSRILFELLLSEIGSSYEETRSEVWDKLKKTQEDYEQGITLLTTVIQEKARITAKTDNPKEGVSVSNY